METFIIFLECKCDFVMLWRFPGEKNKYFLTLLISLCLLIYYCAFYNKNTTSIFFINITGIHLKYKINNVNL